MDNKYLEKVAKTLENPNHVRAGGRGLVEGLLGNVVGGVAGGAAGAAIGKGVHALTRSSGLASVVGGTVAAAGGIGGAAAGAIHGYKASIKNQEKKASLKGFAAKATKKLSQVGKEVGTELKRPASIGTVLGLGAISDVSNHLKYKKKTDK